MKKKSLIIISVSLILICCLLFVAPVDFGVKKQITIHANITDVAKQITDLHNWPHWKTALKNQDTSLFQFSNATNNANAFMRFDNDQYTILHYNAASVTVRENNGSANAVYHTIFAFPDSFGTATTIQWIKSVSALLWVKEKLNSSVEMETDLNNLKNFMEDPKQYYGFPIEIKGVTDTLVMAQRTIISKKNLPTTLKKLYSNIIEYANANKIQINESSPRMAHYHDINKDSIEIMAAITVNKKAPEKNNISYMEMPSHGKMLIGYYQGDYAGLKKLYVAMDNYVFDKHLHIIASPYEKYFTNPQSAQDSMHMKIELHYPIL